MKYLNLTSEQINHYRESGEVLIEIEHAQGSRVHAPPNRTYIYVERENEDVAEQIKRVRYPVSVGDTVGIREEWLLGAKFTPPKEWGYLYKADHEDNSEKWNSTDTMPDEAIRFRFTVGSVEPMEKDGTWFWRILKES